MIAAVENPHKPCSQQKRELFHSIFLGSLECVISFPPLATQIPVPRSILQLLTHEVGWCTSTPGAMCVGCLGGAWRRQVAFQEGDRGPCLLAILSPCPHNTNTHPGRGTGFSLLAKIRIPEASWFHMFFLIESPLGQELLADFHWILNFRFENKIQRAFTRLFFFFLTP